MPFFFLFALAATAVVSSADATGGIGGPSLSPSSSLTRSSVIDFHNDYRPRGGCNSLSRRSQQYRRPAFFSSTSLILFPRGGDGDVTTTAEASTAPPLAGGDEESKSLDDRVEAAMRRLGLETPNSDGAEDEEVAQSSGVEGVECSDGVCTPPPSSVSDAADPQEQAPNPEEDDDAMAVAIRISSEMGVPRDVAFAAVGASSSEESARALVKAEKDATMGVPGDCDEVRQLVSEGYDAYHVRRSLAFAERNVENARAILFADKEDEEADRRAEEEHERVTTEAGLADKAEEERADRMLGGTTSPPKTVVVESNFDPVASAAATTMASSLPKPKPKPEPQQPKPDGAPPPAKKEDVVFELEEVSDFQRLVIESPVPVLLDVYADWCGPCKQLTPALEQICVNAGGMLRLVKVNTDQLRQVSSTLDVKALPTVFGIREGKILHSFQGMPRDEESVRNFLMGVMIPGQTFNPPVTSEEKETYADLSAKLLKLSAGASFSFSAREQLNDKIHKTLDALVVAVGAGETGMAVAEDSAKVLRSLMSNVIRDPFDTRFHRIKLDNKVVASKIYRYEPCMTILKSIGFARDGDMALVVGAGKKIVNIAPFVVGRGCIDKWIDKNRHQISAAVRKRKDEVDRARIAAEEAEIAALRGDEEEEEDEDEEEEEDLNSCTIKMRMEGKKKVHTVVMDGDEPLSNLVDRLPFAVKNGASVQFTCAARRLIVKTTDRETMDKTLSELRLVPAATIVVRVGDGGAPSEVVRGGLAERASAQKKKTGSHSMHSIGLYAKNDGNKAELIDGGGGVMYEQELSDDEDENKASEGESEQEEGKDDETGVDSEGELPEEVKDDEE